MTAEQKIMMDNVPKRLIAAKSNKKKIAIIGLTILGVVLFFIRKRFW